MYNEYDWVVELFKEYEEKEMFDVYANNTRYRVKVVQTDQTLHIMMSDMNGQVMSRYFPIPGLNHQQREKIAEDTLECITEGIPVIWEKVISPHIKGYWDNEWDDIISMEQLSRKPKNPHYLRY